ncbi:MAG: serine/threonine protein kinase [Deltaproteobacteria bacterium]|nr:serine/threonine protein kinase [Deltaproteobacteria bacterium]
MNPPQIVRGAVVLDRYQLVEPIATAKDTSQIWQAIQLNLSRNVALKIYPLSTDPRRVSRRFEREASSLAKLHHANVVTIHDFGEVWPGQPFLAMELLEGRTLAEIIEGEPPLDLRRITQLGLQIARGMRAVHEAGIVHRNLKPANLLLTSRPEDDGNLDVIKILGFGLARVTATGGEEDVTATAMGSSGSPEYLSPEQISQGDPDPRSDVYAIGVILYSLVGGEGPFSGPTKVQVARGHLLEPVPPLSTKRFARAPSSWFDEVVRQCLEKDPDKRPSSAEALVTALEGVVEKEARASRPPGPRIAPSRGAKSSLLEPDPTVFDRPRALPPTPIDESIVNPPSPAEPHDTLVSQPAYVTPRLSAATIAFIVVGAVLTSLALWVAFGR